jgi:hypothetical protein
LEKKGDSSILFSIRRSGLTSHHSENDSRSVNATVNTVEESLTSAQHATRGWENEHNRSKANKPQDERHKKDKQKTRAREKVRPAERRPRSESRR